MEKLLTDLQVAEYFGVDVRTLRRKIKANKMSLNYVPVGRKMMFRSQDVEEYVRSMVVLRDGGGRRPKR